MARIHQPSPLSVLYTIGLKSLPRPLPRPGRPPARGRSLQRWESSLTLVGGTPGYHLADAAWPRPGGSVANHCLHTRPEKSFGASDPRTFEPGALGRLRVGLTSYQGG